MQEITKKDWQGVLDTMSFYKRKEGYVDWVEGAGLKFFDSDPCIGGVRACHVTIDEVKEYAKL